MSRPSIVLILKRTIIKKARFPCIKLSSFSSFSQIEELTPEEQAYKDSITALNLENEAIANRVILPLFLFMDFINPSC